MPWVDPTTVTIRAEVAAEIDAMLLRLDPMPTLTVPEACGYQWTVHGEGVEVPFRCTRPPHQAGEHISLGLAGQVIARRAAGVDLSDGRHGCLDAS